MAIRVIGVFLLLLLLESTSGHTQPPTHTLSLNSGRLESEPYTQSTKEDTRIQWKQRGVTTHAATESWIEFAWRAWSQAPTTTTKKSNPLSATTETESTDPHTHHHHHEHTHRHDASFLFGRSRVSVDNPEPSFVPPARLVATVTDSGDGAHFLVSLLLGSGNASESLPDSTSLTVRLVLDFGSSDLILFSKLTCSTGIVGCQNNVRSTTFQTSSRTNLAKFAISLDGEYLDSGPNYPGGVIGTNLVTLASNLLGTNQIEYYIHNLQMFVTDGSIQTAPANSRNYDATDPLTYSLINSGYYDKADGVLGLAFRSASLVAESFGSSTSAFQTLMGSETPFFSIDLTDGQLFLDGVSEAWRKKVVWSDGAVSDILPGYHSFRVYHLKICGVDMFQNLTSSWHALVDSGASCLGLPAEMYDMVISWLPLTCDLGRVDGLPHICQLKSDVKKTVLPTIGFKMADSGTELFISLSDLLFASVTYSNRICLYRSGSIINGPSFSNSIVFGGRVLKQFYAAFDMTGTGKIGLANKVTNIRESKIQCASRVACSGMEVHYDPLNLCLPPPCSDYYFFEYDATTKSCKLGTGFHILCGLIIGIFILAELILNEVVIYLSNKVQQNGIAAN